VYPALLPPMRTPRLPVVHWTDAPADLNALVRFAERRNLVSASVPSHFNWPLLLSTLTRFSSVRYMCGARPSVPHSESSSAFINIRTTNALPQLPYRSSGDASCFFADIWILLDCRRVHFHDPSGLQELRWWAKWNWSCKCHTDLYPDVKSPELPKLLHCPHSAWHTQYLYSGLYSTGSSGVWCSGNDVRNSENNSRLMHCYVCRCYECWSSGGTETLVV